MRSFNKVILIGHLTRDPELRQTPNGQNVASFSIATNHTWNNAQTGERQESVDFHNIVAWGKLAETCGQYLKKGSAILAEGRLTNRSWEAQDGSKRNTTEIILNNMNMLSPKGEGGSASYGDSSNQAMDAPSQNDGVDIPADTPAKQSDEAGKIDIDEILDF